MVDHILLVVAHVGQPRPAGAGVVLDLVAGPDTGAGYRVAPGILSTHCLNHVCPINL
jgi:hypothetical protein